MPQKTGQANRRGKVLSHDARKRRLIALFDKLDSATVLTKKEVKELRGLAIDAYEIEPCVVKTQKELAAILGIDKRTVERWETQGIPKTPQGYYNCIEISLWNEQRKKGEADDGESPNLERLIKEEKLRRERMENDAREGKLISIDEVERGRAQRIAVIKRNFMSLPRTMAPILADTIEPREVEGLLAEQIEAICAQFAGQDLKNISKTTRNAIPPARRRNRRGKKNKSTEKQITIKT